MLIFHCRGNRYINSVRKSLAMFYKQIYERKIEYNNFVFLKELGIIKEEELKKYSKTEISFKVPTDMILGVQLENIKETSFLIANKYWKVFISQKSEFLITDTPYVDISVSNTFWGNDINERYQIFTLSPNIYIEILKSFNKYGKGIHRKDITNKINLVDEINKRSLLRSQKFGFHKNKKIIERIRF